MSIHTQLKPLVEQMTRFHGRGNITGANLALLQIIKTLTDTVGRLEATVDRMELEKKFASMTPNEPTSLGRPEVAPKPGVTLREVAAKKFTPEAAKKTAKPAAPKKAAKKKS